MSAYSTAIFDLDGTIIDSFPGIQHSFEVAYEKALSKPCSIDIKALIGPPIGDIFKKVTQIEDPAIVNAFVQEFQTQYDTEGYKHSVIYDGYDEVFRYLEDLGMNLYIATYKRDLPTKLILAEKDLKKYFNGIYTVDMHGERFPNKTAMVSELLLKNALNPEKCLFIGDTLHDCIASKENNIKFAFASFGYGSMEDAEIILKKPLDLLNYI